MGAPHTRVPERSWLAEHLLELSADARRRLKWMDYYDQHGRNARRTCRHFDISPEKFYTWRRRYDPRDLTTLEARSRAPRRRRRPTWSPALARAVRQLRQQYPRWGKDKLVVLLRRAGWPVSTSMVGRILTQLRRRGDLVEPRRRAISARRARPPRPSAVRKPKDYAVTAPGDLVQLDTLDVRPLPGVTLKHLAGRDTISRWDVFELYSRATAGTARQFLDALAARMPFAVRALQVDGGSEFPGEFEQECARRGIRLFVLPPHSPKLNGRVERSNRTHTEEFYEVVELEWTATAARAPARRWEQVYNTVRPHQALGYRTPREFLEEHGWLAPSPRASASGPPGGSTIDERRPTHIPVSLKTENIPT
jgi:putative transposase